MNNLEHIITQNRVGEYKHMVKNHIKPLELIIEIIIKQNNEKNIFFSFIPKVKKC